MKRLIFTFFFLFLSFLLSAQVKELNRLGQTPGGFGWHVNYDSASKRLFVGCGTSVWIYDASNTTSAQTIKVIAKRPLLGTINDLSLSGNILFAAATHDGVYALDATSDSLTVIAHYLMPNDSGAYHMWRTHDTLYVANSQKVNVLKYSLGSFTPITTFGITGAYCVTGKGNYIAVGSQSLSKGTIAVYNKNNLATPFFTWQYNKIWDVQNLQFADRRNDVLYICGGPEDLFFSKSNLFAIQFTGSSVTAIDSFTVSGGILNYAQMDIINLDSRNDTLFVATTAAFNSTTFPYCYAAIIDASHFPADTLHQIGFYVPGLWHFDVALMKGTPYVATSSEWLGVCINNISHLQPGDTLGFLETGGYGIKSQIKHDTLWVAQEGYGLAAYKLDSLYYRNGYMRKSMIFHVFRQFVTDFDFINDTLIVMTSSYGDIYNIKPWLSGHAPVLADSLGKGSIESVRTIHTNTGIRVIAGWNNTLSPPESILLYDPFSSTHPHPVLDSIQTRCSAYQLAVSNDTLYCDHMFNNKYYLAAYRIYNDSFRLIDTIAVPGEITSIAADNGNVAIGCTDNLVWYKLTGSTFVQEGTYFNWYIRPQGLVLKNNKLYVADKFYGMEVFSLASVTSATLVAECQGTMGWTTLFGSNNVDVGDDGTIYLADQHAGIIVIEPFDTTLTGIIGHATINGNSNIEIFPNPASDKLILMWNNNANENANVSIYDITGQLLYSDKINSSSMDIDIHNLPNGLYILTLKDSKAVMEKKFIKE